VRMMVFDHRMCRWLPWHGTRTAWLKLPHAVVAAGVCALPSVALLPVSAPPHMPSPPPRAAAVAPASTDGPPVTALLPSNLFITIASPDFGSTVAMPTPIPAPVLGQGDPPLPSNGPLPLDDPAIPDPRVPITQVPEPGTLTLLAGAVLLLTAARRFGVRDRRRPRGR
jgi:hypothetical protein